MPTSTPYHSVTVIPTDAAEVQVHTVSGIATFTVCDDGMEFVFDDTGVLVEARGADAREG